MLLNEQAATKKIVQSAVADRYSTIGTIPSTEEVIPVGRLWAERLGYPPKLLDTAPARSLASFTGIGTPVLHADLSPGERVLDLGCGAGLDSIISAHLVSPHGHVQGVDLAPGMITAARAAVAEAALANVTITEAAAESLPIASGSIDVAVVNGLFNLAPDKTAVASELRRVLHPHARLIGAEIVIVDERPPEQLDLEAWFR